MGVFNPVLPQFDLGTDKSLHVRQIPPMRLSVIVCEDQCRSFSPAPPGTMEERVETVKKRLDVRQHRTPFLIFFLCMKNVMSKHELVCKFGMFREGQG
jgi:hypothetical protein